MFHALDREPSYNIDQRLVKMGQELKIYVLIGNGTESLHALGFQWTWSCCKHVRTQNLKIFDFE